MRLYLLTSTTCWTGLSVGRAPPSTAPGIHTNTLLHLGVLTVPEPALPRSTLHRRTQHSMDTCKSARHKCRGGARQGGARVAVVVRYVQGATSVTECLSPHTHAAGVLLFSRPPYGTHDLLGMTLQGASTNEHRCHNCHHGNADPPWDVISALGCQRGGGAAGPHAAAVEASRSLLINCSLR